MPLSLLGAFTGFVVATVMAFGCENATAGDEVCRVAGHPLSWGAVWLLPSLAMLAVGYTRPRRAFGWTATLGLALQAAVFVALSAHGV